MLALGSYAAVGPPVIEAVMVAVHPPVHQVEVPLRRVRPLRSVTAVGHCLPSAVGRVVERLAG